jgi:hypothetical protein
MTTRNDPSGGDEQERDSWDGTAQGGHPGQGAPGWYGDQAGQPGWYGAGAQGG